jgi:hypothetical protein
MLPRGQDGIRPFARPGLGLATDARECQDVVESEYGPVRADVTVGDVYSNSQYGELTMPKYFSSNHDVLLGGNEYDLEDVEADISRQFEGALPFPGAQHFNELMHEKMRPKKVAKFRASRKQESNY